MDGSRGPPARHISHPIILGRHSRSGRAGEHTRVDPEEEIEDPEEEKTSRAT